jgi:hypothetical protein
MKSTSMKVALREFKKYLSSINYEYNSLEQVAREFWSNQYKCNNAEREKELIEMYGSN